MKKTLFASSAALCFALLTCTGCGTPSDQPDLGTVTGRITYDGKPVANYIVNFQPPHGRPSVGSTDADGSYVLDYTLTTKGAKVDTHKVFLIFDSSSDVNQMAGVEGDDSQVDTEAGLPLEARMLLKAYGSVETTSLTAVVKGGANVLDFELKPGETPEGPQ